MAGDTAEVDGSGGTRDQLQAATYRLATVVRIQTGLIQCLFSVAQKFIDASYASGKIGLLPFTFETLAEFEDVLQCHELLQLSEKKRQRIWEDTKLSWASGQSREVQKEHMQDWREVEGRESRRRENQRKLESNMFSKTIQQLLISQGLLQNPSSPTQSSSDGDFFEPRKQLSRNFEPSQSPPAEDELWLQLQNTR